MPLATSLPPVIRGQAWGGKGQSAQRLSILLRMLCLGGLYPRHSGRLGKVLPNLPTSCFLELVLQSQSTNVFNLRILQLRKLS